MKLKFFLLLFLLLFARSCDFYSTSLWFFDNPAGEQNPLYKFFGVGWNGLIITNLIVVGFIIYCFFFYTFKYSIDKPFKKPIGLTDYISEVYFNESGRFYQIFYKTPKNKKRFFGHVGYVLIRVAIVGSFLATIHNLGQFYNVSIYNTFREIVGRPLFVIYGFVFVSLIYFSIRLWKKEYEFAKALYDDENPN